MKCRGCEEDKEKTIKKYQYWTVLIHPNQYYLGRCIIKLNRHIIDLCDTTKSEQDELFEVMTRLRNALKKLFQPDLFNYASLGNSQRHLHLHFIPRYKQKRIFENIEFVDKKWGDHWEPYDHSYTIPNQVLHDLKELIKNHL